MLVGFSEGKPMSPTLGPRSGALRRAPSCGTDVNMRARQVAHPVRITLHSPPCVVYGTLVANCGPNLARQWICPMAMRNQWLRKGMAPSNKRWPLSAKHVRCMPPCLSGLQFFEQLRKLVNLECCRRLETKTRGHVALGMHVVTQIQLCIWGATRH